MNMFFLSLFGFMFNLAFMLLMLPLYYYYKYKKQLKNCKSK